MSDRDDVRSPIEGKVVLVTGASEGIGKAIARRLGAHRARVGLIGRRRDPLEAAAADVAEAGGEALVCPADVTAWDEVQQAVNAARDRWGTIDVLVNNAGYGYYESVDHMPEDEWDRTMAVNLKAVFLCTKAVLPVMQQRRTGHILNISSTLGTRGDAGKAAYCASKWGLYGFSESLAAECRPYQIKVATIGPGLTRTGFAHTDAAKKEHGLDPDQVARTVVHMLNAPADVLIDRTLILPFYP